MNSIVDEITASKSEAVIVVVANPVDVLTFAALKRSRWRRHRIFGSGTVLTISTLLDEEYGLKDVCLSVPCIAKGPEAKELADQHFLETLVRLHRAGEGAPYTGIKDEPVEPIVDMADKTLAQGSAAAMIEKMIAHMAHAVNEKFSKALAAMKKKDKSVEAGREFVEAYVTYMHYVEGIHGAIMSSGGHQHTESAAAPSRHEQHK